MDNAPLDIKLVRVYAKNKHILKILQEYFNGLPHIKYTNYGLCKGYAYFVFPSTKAIWYVLQNIRHYLNIIHWGMCRSGTYTYEYATSTYCIYHIPPGAWDADELPPRIKIDANLIDKLKSIPEGYYD